MSESLLAVQVNKAYYLATESVKCFLFLLSQWLKETFLTDGTTKHSPFTH